MEQALPDWTNGVGRLVYSRCGACDHVWYLPRVACGRCGSDKVVRMVSKGCGSVYAATFLSRAPTPAFQAIAPYGLLLVDADEGFRFMCLSRDRMAVGDRTGIGFETIDSCLVPVALDETETQDGRQP